MHSDPKCTATRNAQRPEMHSDPKCAVAADPKVGGHCGVLDQAQVPVPLAMLLLMAVQVSKKMLEMKPPKMKTIATIRAAMPATRRPYSTADAPRSFSLAFLSARSICR